MDLSYYFSILLDINYSQKKFFLIVIFLNEVVFHFSGLSNSILFFALNYLFLCSIYLLCIRNGLNMSNGNIIIVLGARVVDNVPSKALLQRLQMTIKYLKNNMIIIVSGGKTNLNIEESTFMKNYLKERGVNPTMIIEENKSINTYENIIYSSKIIDTLSDENKYCTFITSDYHTLRTLILANKKINNYRILACKTPYNIFVKNMNKEIMKIMKYYIEFDNCFIIGSLIFIILL